MPTGLSRISQPETGRPFFLPRRAISPHPPPCGEGRRAASGWGCSMALLIHPHPRLRRDLPTRGRWGASSAPFSFFLILLVQVPRHVWRLQQAIDPGEILEAGIEPETD